MSEILKEAQRVLKLESEAVLALIQQLNQSFEKSVELISSCRGKVIVSGIGKSGHIARKIASTLASTGTPAFFLHPAESTHGDLGIVTQDDLLVAISYGGETIELVDLLKYSIRKGLPVVAMTGNGDSTLAKMATHVLSVQVAKEACPLGLAPTSSSTATLALGDALAMAVLKNKGFSAEEFAQYHPGGKLGRKLLTRVKDIMHSGDSMPLVLLSTPMKKVVSIMTSGQVRGVAGVVDENGKIIGVITDGDLRRRLEKSQNPLEGLAKDVMVLNPKTISGEELADKAFLMMEKYSIQMLFVTEDNKPMGVIHFHDLLKAQIR